MAFDIIFSEEKNQLLRATRGISFDDAILAINNGGLLADIENPSKKFKYQRLYVIRINDYVYAVSFVINKNKNEIFFKTIYPSRVLTKKYVRGSKK